MGLTDRIAERRHIGVVVERRSLASRWATHSWHPHTVLLDVPEAAPWTKVGESAAGAHYYAGPATLALVPAESESYLYNISGRVPQVWVVLRPCAPADDGHDIELDSVTVAAGEAELLASGGGLVVEGVAMAPEIEAWVAAFVARHHADQPRFQRRRSPHVSEGQALAEKLELDRDDE